MGRRSRADPLRAAIQMGYPTTRKIGLEWGDTQRADMTFSATKSYLGVIAGVAVEQGLIKSIDDPMRDYALDVDSDQNKDITWRHLCYSRRANGRTLDKPDTVSSVQVQTTPKGDTSGP